MSAFYDIWIGATSPTQVRLGNGEWENVSEDAGYSLSTPAHGNATFVSTTTASGYTLVVLGQFYESIDQVALLQACVQYVGGKSTTFVDPAGHYILFLFNETTRDWHVFTNRFGTYHAYWLNNGGQNVISTYFLGLARHSNNKSLDWEGITGFFGLGFFPGTKTYLTSIQILAPASHYHFDASLNLVGSERYWNWAIASVPYNEVEHSAALGKVLSNSLGHATKGQRIALPISGGLDSRMLAGIVTQDDLGYKSIWAYSYGYSKKSAENSIASRIAGTRKIQFESTVIPNYLFDRLHDITEAVELFQYVDGTRQACMQNEIATNADAVVGGHWGDVWMDSTLIEGHDLFPIFEKKVLKRGRQWLFSEIANNFQKDPESYLREHFTSTVKEYNHLENAGLKFKAYKTDQWSFRWTLASIRMYQSAAFPVLPFYDKNVADLLLTVPEEILNGRKMQIDFIKKYHPDLARITWQEYGRDLYSYQKFNNRNIAYRAASKLLRIVSKEKNITRNWEVFYMNPEGRRKLEALLIDNPQLDDFVGKKKRQELINDLYRNPTGANGYTVSMLLTFGTALKRIFD
ncbi:hypothetical protein [Polluticoccus soli]|uniref:hypothetical protein n=1 Tax=Polluticoccus soli TaxID=3034150 RepID=UPI0023E13D1D|nr:hypothetical protein [Flavipsychrobacter sp. JY13-12]